MSIFHAISTVSLIILLCGMYYRKDKKKHIPLMITAFVIDVALVLYIEVNRAVVHQVTSEIKEMSGIMVFHVIISVITLILFGLQIILGLILKRGAETARFWHKYSGWSLLVFRLGNYVTSYLIYIF